MFQGANHVRYRARVSLLVQHLDRLQGDAVFCIVERLQHDPEALRLGAFREQSQQEVTHLLARVPVPLGAQPIESGTRLQLLQASQSRLFDDRMATEQGTLDHLFHRRR